MENESHGDQTTTTANTPADQGMVHTSCRVTRTTLDRLDAIAGAIQRKQREKVGRAEVIRLLLADALPRFETNLLGKGPSKKP